VFHFGEEKRFIGQNPIEKIIGKKVFVGFNSFDILVESYRASSNAYWDTFVEFAPSNEKQNRVMIR
jgi:hypothetical protein